MSNNAAELTVTNNSNEGLIGLKKLLQRITLSSTSSIILVIFKKLVTEDLEQSTVQIGKTPIKLQREVDFHDNVISFYGITSTFSLDGGTLRNFLRENFKNLTWNNKFNLAFQMAYAVSCLHGEVIVHRDLLVDFGLSKRIDETSNSRSNLFGMVPYVDPKIFWQKEL
ncbi:hypothetical protein C1645_813103 [Glomus cerebriforme]|uniref:Protein kinase domain-containing protein n=1 Tax=Glomus cerebriforme TaxID=658196 RepID=A0A397TJU8_9GLOM|nr:hypothetical protein C1645_813103 [Glomus cerebriforme]